MTLEIHALISGRVQGVGFRHATAHQAHTLGLAGWVRNLPDGRVEAVFQGPDSALQSMESWLRAGGPPLARVDALEWRERKVAQSYPGFSVRV
jgi:acylphosphatase